MKTLESRVAYLEKVVSDFLEGGRLVAMATIDKQKAAEAKAKADEERAEKKAEKKPVAKKK